MARHPGIVISALSWNLFHGRDFPPDPALFTWRSRLLRRSESNGTHLQVNRPLFDEFAAVLEREDWDVALLQEVPPRWHTRLCDALAATGALVPTSRNAASSVRARIAAWNPDLIASNEGGSNQILVRPPWRIAATRRLTLALFPERRRALWARLERPDAPPLAIVNMHASADRPAAASRELIRAAEWSAGDPRLVFGGDLNVRLRTEAATFAELERRFHLAPPTSADAIDHLLSRGLEVLDPPSLLPPERREVEGDSGLRIRLSDHAPAVVRLAMT